MEKNKTYKVWRMLVSNPSENECLQIGRIRDCRRYLEAVRKIYEKFGWKLIVADRMLAAIPQDGGIAEYVYFITENVTSDVTFKI